MKGIIVRVHLKQFMVFTDIEILPGRNVNVIIAPNGCGKSSLIAGIMLGLCGKPHDIGRGSNVGAFVKTGFSEAYIEIELLNPGEDNYVITRHIFRQNNTSKWLLNGSKATQKQIEELMLKLHIQVDNLCQVLPQDRVYEFSRMNPQTLLENTEKSVGPEILLKYHNDLKEMSKIKTVTGSKLQENTSRMEREIAKNRSIQSAIDLMHKKQVFMREIKVLKQQRAWVMYREQYAFVQEMKESLKKAKQNLDLHKKRETEITAAMNKLRALATTLTQSQQKKLEEKQSSEMKIQSALKEIENQQDALDKVDEKFEETKQNEEGRVKELEQFRQHLSKLECDLANYNNVSENEVKQKVQEIGVSISNLTQQLTNTNHELETIQDKIDNIKHHIKAEENKKKRFEDQSNQRLETLRRVLPDVHQAVLWLRSNSHEFQHKIHEPMMLEMDIKDDSYITCLEEAIPKRDLQAFTCENIDDMNKFIAIMREQKKLTINVLHSGPEHPSSSSYQPRYTMDQLRPYGFKIFIKDMFTAPETIMKYLCRTVSIYRIPVGSSKVDEVFESIPHAVNFFFSETNKYFVRISKYSKEKCVSVNSITHPKLLSTSVNKAEIARVIESIKRLEGEKNIFDKQLSQLQSKYRNEEMELAEMKDEKRKLQARVGAKEVTERRIKAKRDQIARVEAEKIDIEHERIQTFKKKAEIISQICSLDQKLRALVQKLDEALIGYEETKWKSNRIKAELKQRDMESRNIIHSCAEQSETAKKQEQEYLKARNEAKEIHTEALKYSGGSKPPDNYYQGITQNREQLSKQIQELQAKADFMTDTNKSVIEEFNERKKTIRALSEHIKVLNEKEKQLNETMSEYREKWLPQLQQFIEKINTNFGKYFAKLGCAGEVLLMYDDPDNYEQYGINIKVKFRDGDKLQDLNQYTQSGGERSVATALYMIAMQELTHVPFRCVDEINQGMDPVNERRVFELLANATEAGETTPQYFLLTPKLLPGLTYSQKMSVTCILNGSIQKMDHWDLDKQMTCFKRRKARKSD